MDGILSLYNLMYSKADRAQGQAPVNEDDLLMEIILTHLCLVVALLGEGS